MIHWKITGEGFVTLNSKDGNASGPVTYNPPTLKRELEQSFGAFGHILNPDMTTPIDMDYALRQRFGNDAVEVLKGADMVAIYDPKLPEGAVT